MSGFLELAEGQPAAPRELFLFSEADLKQNRGQLLWTNPRGGFGGPRAGQVLLLQQTSMVPAPPPPAQPRNKPQTRMAPGVGRRKPSSFLRIAPHPSKTPPEDTSPSQGLQHLSKQVLCPKVKREEEPASVPSSSTLLPMSSPLSGERQISPSSASISSSSSALRAIKGLPGSTGPAGAARSRRFLNTMRVLKQSGLLDISLRTQELMRRSAATQQDIGQLGQHTRLLCQLAGQPGAAAREEPSGRTPWEKLHQAMAQSGGYPSLTILHRESPRCPGRGRALTVSLSSSPSPGLNQNTAGSEPSGKVTIMPPDSSTG
ncbi:CLOCK-interacting pacemaker [Merluccius polli]|uniref:CLOCK-interacting pacemaker n=1 Tax=Merluccius polli TaxID=89951 RepID=A0AA47NBZ8_MERPO|nr:CLOCK-interacting pacemaker [Merluccius polli]